MVVPHSPIQSAAILQLLADLGHAHQVLGQVQGTRSELVRIPHCRRGAGQLQRSPQLADAPPLARFKVLVLVVVGVLDGSVVGLLGGGSFRSSGRQVFVRNALATGRCETVTAGAGNGTRIRTAGEEGELILCCIRGIRMRRDREKTQRVTIVPVAPEQKPPGRTRDTLRGLFWQGSIFSRRT